MADNLQSILNSGNKSGGSAALAFNKFDYYSGSQIAVWFGNVFVDDVASIQWQRQQNKKPIYGYASQMFDSVANGTVIIQGSFIINFKQSGFLSMVMDEIQQIYSGVTVVENYEAVQQLVQMHLRMGTFGPKTSEEIVALGNSPDFIAEAAAFENIIWEDVKKPPTTTGPDVYQPMIMPDGFDILINYGSTSGNEHSRYTDYLQSAEKALLGVHLIGESQVIQVGGQPVMEQYDFIARNTDAVTGTRR
jgi:hypothetical protein